MNLLAQPTLPRGVQPVCTAPETLSEPRSLLILPCPKLAPELICLWTSFASFLFSGECFLCLEAFWRRTKWNANGVCRKAKIKNPFSDAHQSHRV